ncbi:MAG: energy transducer TonB, partial [Candidatus Angelobacter sp.]
GLLHTIFATAIRCHVVTFEITTRDAEVLESLSQHMLQLTIPPAAYAEAGGGEFPTCIKNYADSGNVIHKVDPVDVGPRFTRVPARIIIDKQGRVKHVHVLNAFPDQARSVENALLQWTFKPYLQNGQPVEVETGILFEFGALNKSAAGAVMIAPGNRDQLSPTKKGR